MATPASYSIGTISVAANGLTVTGTGTQWLAGGVRADDVFVARGLSVSIASVASATSLTLTQPWPGAALTGAAYEVRYVSDAARVLAKAQAAMALLEEGGSSGEDVDFVAEYNAGLARP